MTTRRDFEPFEKGEMTRTCEHCDHVAWSSAEWYRHTRTADCVAKMREAGVDITYLRRLNNLGQTALMYAAMIRCSFERPEHDWTDELTRAKGIFDDWMNAVLNHEPLTVSSEAGDVIAFHTFNLSRSEPDVGEVDFAEIESLYENEPDDDEHESLRESLGHEDIFGD